MATNTMTATATPLHAARNAGLRYVSVSPLGKGISRKKSGKGFRYFDHEGKAIRDADEVRRIQSLAIPPAWTDVWICPSPLGHIQAIGRNARGRRQYRYHPKWREVRDETKYGQLAAFGHVLPAIRRRVRRDLARNDMPREKVIATVVELLDRTMMRVGNEEYARHNDSYGLTTLRGRHAKVRGGELELRFRGKSGKEHRVKVEDRRLARVIRTLQDAGAQIAACDPEGVEQARAMLDGVEFVDNPWQAIEGASAVVLITEWDAYRALDLNRMKESLAAPVLVDLRNIYDRDAAENAGLFYHAVGR